MSVLDGFYSTWKNARETFGAGIPETGEHYDRSSTLSSLQSGLKPAEPGSRWTGAAATNYNTAHTEHGRVIGELAGLDQRLKAHIDQSAHIVANGRRDLDNVHKWVTDAANSVPQGANRDQALMPIVHKGLTQLQDVVNRSNNDLNTVATGMGKLNSDYQALGTGQKFGGDKDKDGLTALENKEDEEKDPRKKAEQDVQDALAGDKEAAARVEEALKGIKPGQDLTPEQGSYLSQMQAQQHGMSVDDLKKAEERLGDQKHIIGDSWQLMSNDDVRFPKTDTTVDALDDPSKQVKGGADQLPQSVQDSLRNAGQLTHRDGGEEAVLQHDKDLYQISQIVKDGHPELQTGTELDREMIRAADKVMDRYEDGSNNNMNYSAANVAQNIFEASGNDHQIIHDHITGTHGDNGDGFLHDITRIAWQDDGQAAGSLLSWTHETSGPEAGIAGATARTYAEYIGSHPELMDLAGHRTLGEVNPHLAQGMAEGLAPYVNNIAGTSGGLDTFQRSWLNEGLTLDDDVSTGTLPEAKGVFSVLNTDENAAKIINGAAYGQAVAHDVDYAQHPNPSEKPAQLYDSATLRGLVDVGTHNAFEQFRENQVHTDKDEYTWKSTAYDSGVKALSAATALTPGGPVNGPALDVVGTVLKNDILGPPPADLTSHPVPRLAPEHAETEMLNTLHSVGHPITGIPLEYHENNDPNGRILTSEEMRARHVDASVYQQVVTDAINNTLGYNFQDGAIKDRYDQVAADPNPPQ